MMGKTLKLWSAIWKRLVNMKKYILIILILLITYNYIQISIPIIEELELKSEKIDKEIKITQISDYHNNKFLRKKRLLKQIKQYDPDIIVLTGDIIDVSTKDWIKSLELLKELKKISRSIYFVSGNHEMKNEGYNLFLSDLRSLGINIMDNKVEELNISDNRVKLIGVEYYFKEHAYKNIMEKVEEDTFNLLLSHSPDRIITFLTKKEDLILSGHTHGGQVRIPFIGALIAPGQGLFPEYDRGVYELEKTTLYIDSGLGNSMLPIRLFNRVQISNISIEKE